MKSIILFFISIIFFIFSLFYFSSSNDFSSNRIFYNYSFNKIVYTSKNDNRKSFTVEKIKYKWWKNPLITIQSNHHKYIASFHVKNLIYDFSNLEVFSIIENNKENLKKIALNIEDLNHISLLDHHSLVHKFYISQDETKPFLIDKNRILKINPLVLSRINKNNFELRQRNLIFFGNKKLSSFYFESNERKLKLDNFNTQKFLKHKKLKSIMIDSEIDFFSDEIQNYNKVPENLTDKIVLTFKDGMEVKISFYKEVKINHQRLIPLKKDFLSIFSESISFMKREKYIQFREDILKINQQ